MSRLVNGEIPAGKPCPWAKDCGARMARCPAEDNLKEWNFSCGLARGLDMIEGRTEIGLAGDVCVSNKRGSDE